MLNAFSAAFEKWETEYRTDPAKFMSRAECEGKSAATVADLQARLFVSYLDELSGGKPWNEIGAEAASDVA